MLNWLFDLLATRSASAMYRRKRYYQRRASIARSRERAYTYR